MPEMDGFEFLEKLTPLRFTGGVILMTEGDADMLIIAKDIAVSKGLNVIGSFLKPVSLAQMASVMAGLPS